MDEHKQMVSRIEARNAAEVGPLVKKYGVAIWRGLIPKSMADIIVAAVAARLPNADGQSYVTRKGGVVSSLVLPEDVKAARITEDIKQAFYYILGERKPVIPDDGLSGSGIYVTAPEFSQTHPWHQDLSGCDFKHAACVWVAVTDAGLSAPGLSFVLNNPGRGLDADLDDYVRQGPVLSPFFQVGDAAFFDSYSLHATNKKPEMKYARVAYKLTGYAQDA